MSTLTRAIEIATIAHKGLCVKYENSRLYLKRESLYLLQVSMRS